MVGLNTHRAPRRKKPAERRRTRRRSPPDPQSDALRSSFGSDGDLLSPHPSFLHLDRDPEKTSSHLSPNQREPEKEEEEEDEDEEKFLQLEEEEEKCFDPAKHSFSHALRECQNRRIRSEAHESSSSSGRRQRKRRPASLDLNVRGANAATSSPRFLAGGMRRASAASSCSRSGAFPSPGTPNYPHGAVAGYQKGWSSERVPLPANSRQRCVGGSGMLPFGNGRTLPSKWEDAEKWIFSPASIDGASRPSVVPPHHRRPKSKSGPLGPAGGIGVSSAVASPLIQCFDSGRVNFTAGSPFMAGVLVTNHECRGKGNSGRGGDGGRSNAGISEPYIVRSTSVHEWSDMLIESSSSLPSSQCMVQDEKTGSTREIATIISSAVSRKDMATQMSPDKGTHSSPNQMLSLSLSSLSADPIAVPESCFSKTEVRDVPVDGHITMTRWSQKHSAQGSDKRLTNILQWKKKTMESHSRSWEVADSAKCVSKYKREEAKITAWENLQKAKAEAAIRKLEMKLEKKRSSSLDKILNKLRSAQRKAQEMRNATNSEQAHQVAKSTKRATYFCRTGHISSLSGCFTCHAF